MRRAHYNTRI